MTAAQARAGPRILYVQYTNPAAYPPLLHSIDLFAAAGCTIRVLGLDTMSRELPLRDRDGLEVTLVGAERPGWRQKAHYIRFGLRVREAVRRFRPDWIYASDALAAPLVRRLPGVRVVYHEHDTPAAAATPGAASWWMRRVMAARAALVRRAEVCVVPNEARAAALGRAFGRPDVTVVWNCPRRSEAEPVVERGGTPGLRVLYHGSIVPSRLPATVVDALALLPADVHLVLAGYETVGHPGYVEVLADRARARGVTDRVHYAGILARSDLLALAATCDVGLALFPARTADPNESTMVGASNKVFEYLARGVPVLTTDAPEWRRTFEDAGVAWSCQPDSAESVAAALAGFRRDPAARRAMGERGRQRVIDDWNYDVRFAPVLAAVAGRTVRAPSFSAA